MFGNLRCKLGLHDVKDIGDGNQICGRCGVTRSMECGGVGKWKDRGRHWIARINLSRDEIQALEDYLKLSYKDRVPSPLRLTLNFPNGREGWVSVSFGCSESVASLFFDLDGVFESASTRDVQRLFIRDANDGYSVLIKERRTPDAPRIEYLMHQEA